MTDLKPSDRDVSRAIRSWLHEDRHEDASRIAGAVLDRVEAAPRRRAGWPAWRTPIMNKIVIYGLGTAAVVIVGLLLGYRFLGTPGNVGSGGPTATPAPTATPDPTATPQPSSDTLASGSFTAHLGDFGEAFDIEATRAGDGATGTMDVSFADSGKGSYSVEVQCTQTTEDGMLMIGGVVTVSTYEPVSDGAYVAIVLVPGPPVRTILGIDVFGNEGDPAESCSAYVGAISSDSAFLDAVRGGHSAPIVGDLQLGQ